jgi:triphosphatase
MAREIELKLGVPPKSLKPLLQALAKRSGKAPATAELVSTYYDTADLELKRRSLTLRVRQQDGHFIQGVKSAPDGPIGRGEWEEEITGARPDLRARHTGRHLPKQIKRRRLSPLFTTDVNRTQLDLQPRRASRIEAAIDRGEIRAGDDGRSAPIHELELEL